MAVLGTGMIMGEEGAMIDLIDKEKVSLPVLRKYSTRIDLNYLLYVFKKMQMQLLD